MNTKAIELRPPKSGAWQNESFSKIQRFAYLKDALHKHMQEFLKKLNLLSESVIEFDDKDGELVLERQEFVENKEERSIKKSEFNIFSRSMQDLFVNLTIYQETAYYQHDMSDLAAQNKKTITQDTEKLLLDHCWSQHRSLTAQITSTVERLQKEVLRKFRTEMMIDEELANNPTIKAHVKAYQTNEKLFVDNFNEAVAKRFEDGMSEVFVSGYRRELSREIKETIINGRLVQKHMRNRPLFQKEIEKELDNMFYRYFIEGEITELFDVKVFHNTQNIVTLFNIILLTDFQEIDDAKNQAYLDILGKIYVMFIESYAQAFPELPEYLAMIKAENKSQDAVLKLKQALNENIIKWSHAIKQSENLSALMSLFLALNFASEQGLDKSYNCHTRYMLMCIFRNLKDGDMQFTNFQVLCCMESLIMEYAKNTDSSQIKMNSSGSLVVQDVLERIRTTSVKSIAEHIHHEGQLAALAEKFDETLVKPEKFFFEKISDSDVRSKTVIICVSGFVSEDFTKTGEWKAVCDAFPDTEVIAVNWKSNAVTSIGQNMLDSVKEKFNSGSGIMSKLWKGGMAIYKSGKEAWSKTYEQAVLTGKYLAHFLAHTELFEGHVVNLMGFSLGTLVVMSCIWELEKMNRHDIVYDVLVMGGVAHIGAFHASMLKAVGHKVTNCYCASDYILQYLLSHVNQNINPIGLGPILWGDSKVQNLDVTHIANGHVKYRGVLGDILARTNFNEDLGYMLTK